MYIVDLEASLEADENAHKSRMLGDGKSKTK